MNCTSQLSQQLEDFDMDATDDIDLYLKEHWTRIENDAYFKELNKRQVIIENNKETINKLHKEIEIFNKTNRIQLGTLSDYEARIELLTLRCENMCSIVLAQQKNLKYVNKKLGCEEKNTKIVKCTDELGCPYLEWVDKNEK